jgi:hypothetical protein
MIGGREIFQGSASEWRNGIWTLIAVVFGPVKKIGPQATPLGVNYQFHVHIWSGIQRQTCKQPALVITFPLQKISSKVWQLDAQKLY